jgi:hypothetical protein
VGDCSVDPTRMLLHGLSDGASYGLTLGMANGDLFGRVVASSPGFIAATDSPNVGRPRFSFRMVGKTAYCQLTRRARGLSRNYGSGVMPRPMMNSTAATESRWTSPKRLWTG